MNYFSPPILLLFFVRSGLNFNIGALFSGGENLGPYPLIVIGIFYFLMRIIGKYLGSYAGCQIAGKSDKVKKYLGLALFPQAGVAIGLAALGARILGGSTGAALNTVIMTSSILYELIGPACAKSALYLSGSYSDKLEEVAPVEEKNPDGSEKSAVELLIERIHKIQSELPDYTVDEDEKAYDQAIAEQEQYYRNRRRN